MKSAIDRVMAKISIQENGCWYFTGKINTYGYGKIFDKGREYMAHRVTHQHAHGEIPNGLGLDHMCHDPKTCAGGKSCLHRRCVNPAHTVPATAKENNSSTRSVKPRYLIFAAVAGAAAEKNGHTTCKHGHPYSPENTKIGGSGERVCMACGRIRALANYYRNKGRVAA